MTQDTRARWSAGERLTIERVQARAYRIPTERPESDGTLTWDSTTLVVVHVHANGGRGLGYTYADAGCAALVNDRLAPLLCGEDAMATGACFHRMAVALRNLGTVGIGAMAMSAVDVALWDCKARRLGCALATLLGPVRADVPGYGSGGFTNLPLEALQHQLAGWVHDGFSAVKMKVGRDIAADVGRVAAARHAIGRDTALFIDANGAYSRGSDRKQALAFAWRCADHDVRWFEEPLSSDDVDGLRLLRDRAPPGMAVSAGEYGWSAADFHTLMRAGAVDVLQADATRCGGVTGFLQVAAQCAAWQVPLSSHCAASLHVPLMLAAQAALHVEHFHDHARIEQRLFDGAPRPERGLLSCDLTRPGLGLEFKTQDAECFRL